MAEVVKKRGRGFNTSSGDDRESQFRLDRPKFLDSEQDSDHIVLSAKGKRAPPRINRPFTSPETNGGVKVGTPPPAPTSPASLNKEPEKPKLRRPRPELSLFTPRSRREPLPLSPEQQTAGKPTGRRSDFSGMDFSKMKEPPAVQTLEQALKSDPIGRGKSMGQAPPVSGLRLEGTSHPSPRVEALTPLPPRASPSGGFRNSAVPRGLVAAMPVAEVVTEEIHEPTETSAVVIEEISQHHEPTVNHSPEASAMVVVTEEIPQYHEPTMANSSEILTVATEGTLQHHEPTTVNSSETLVVDTQATTNIQVEESLANTEDNMVSAAQEFESYQLGTDERFASESSDESESVTSTIRDYDDVSENEAESGDEIVQKKTRKPKPVETSDGKVYYPVAVDEEPYVPLTYEIPPKDLTRLLSLNDDSSLKYWAYNLYQYEEKKITVECCTTLEEFETAAQKFLGEKVIGFDMEWLPRPSKKVWDNVSLIQLAKEDHIALFHLGRVRKEKVEELVPSSLKAILESKDILKVGVSVAGDGSRVKKWLGIEPQGLMELSAIHHVIEYARARRSGHIPRVLISLAKLSERYLQLPIHKGFVRISDWTRPLTPMQISYAATDAYAGLRIFDALQRARVLIDPIPMLPACVKCGEDKKKRGVVTPKLYINGVEAGTSSVSTWGTSFEATTQNNGVIDWAQEVEESIMEYKATAVTKAKATKKKNMNTNTANIEGGPSRNVRARGPEVEFATKWAENHRATRTIGDTTPAPLRAYALWHVKGCSLEETARHLGIFDKTAASYICQAIYTDKLEHDRERIKGVKDVKDVWSRNARGFSGSKRVQQTESRLSFRPRKFSDTRTLDI